MKVTFISPFYENIFEPLGVGYIIAFCKKYCRDIEFKFFHENFDPSLNIIYSGIDSDIVAFSCTSPTYSRGIMYADIIKKTNPDVHIVFGGWHTTTKRDIEHDCIDQIVVGEGEKAFLSILNGNRDPIVTGMMSTFEELPWPDREIIRNERHLELCQSMDGTRTASFLSRKGCPMSCTFCAEKTMSDNVVRVRDPEDVLDEIDYVNKTYNITKFKFLDPTHGFPKSAAVDFCEEKIRRKNTLPWECMSHAAYINKDILKLMKESNCFQLNIGVESGDSRILNDIRKGITVDKIKKVFKWCKEIGLRSRGFFIIGTPLEDNLSIENTKKLIREIDIDVVGTTICCAYPGSDYYSDEFKDIDWSEADEYSNDFWRTENFTNEDLKKIQISFAEEFGDKLPPHQREVMERRDNE